MADETFLLGPAGWAALGHGPHHTLHWAAAAGLVTAVSGNPCTAGCMLQYVSMLQVDLVNEWLPVCVAALPECARRCN